MAAFCKIEIMRRTWDKSPGRETEAAPEPFYSPWAEIGDLYGKELYAALEIGYQDTRVFKVRACKKVKEVYRDTREFCIRYDGAMFDIYAAELVKKERDFVQFKVKRAG